MKYKKLIRHQIGFSIVELAVVILIFGLLTTLGLDQLNAADQFRKHKVAVSNLNQAQIALRLFAIKNFRLPCPDTNNDGYEENICTSQTGSLPYITIKLDQLMPGNRSDNRIQYGVHQLGEDLTGVNINNIGIDGIGSGSKKFIKKLMNIDNLNTNKHGVKTNPYIAKFNDSNSGCSAADGPNIFNPAFVVSLKLDEKLMRPMLNENCFFTDPVLYPVELISVSAPELIGWMKAQK